MSRELSDAEVLPGDILICKNYGAIPLWSVNATHVMIRGMEAVATHNKGGGSSNSVHAALAVGHDAETNKVQVIEAVGTGLVLSHISAEAVVFRCNNTPLSAKVVEAAHELLQLHEDQKGDKKGNSFGKYNFGRAMVTNYRSATFGAQAKRHVTSVANAVEGYVDKDVERMICSAFVALVYQAAAELLEVPNPINRDGQNLTPKALEAYLRSNPMQWTKRGRYNRPTGNGATRWAKRLTARDH
jgi:hypothetical protein